MCPIVYTIVDLKDAWLRIAPVPGGDALEQRFHGAFERALRIIGGMPLHTIIS